MKYLKFIIPIVILAVAGGVFLYTKTSPRGYAVDPLLQGEGKGTLTQSSTTVSEVSGAPADISQIPILTYHSFGPKPEFRENKTQLQYRVTVPVFEAQMKFLAEKKYQTITFADLIENQTSGKPIPENAVVLTFDDGWKSQYEYAVPILEKYGFTGTFFIITNSTGAKSYMSFDELKELHAKGFEIASHTKSHPKLPTLDDVKLLEELQGSKKTLEDRVGITVTTIAYPYYAHDDRVMKVVQSAGYLGARAGWGSFKNDKNHLFEMVSQESVNNPDPFASKRIEG